MESLAAEMVTQVKFLPQMAFNGLVSALALILLATISAAFPRLRFFAVMLVVLVIVVVLQPDAGARFGQAGMYFRQAAGALLGRPEMGVYY